jgi:ribosomal-protein-alanine N-acetyltransferase
MPSLLDLVIESERLRLVAASEEFAEAIFREFTAEITEYMGPKPPDSLEETLAFIRDSRQKTGAGSQFDAAILLNETGEFLGSGGMHDVDSATPELGIWLKKRAHGNAYGLEAVTAVVGWAFENLDITYLKYPVDRRNGPSRRIPEALGGKVEAEYPWLNDSGRELDLLEYRIYPPQQHRRSDPSPSPSP